MYAEKIRPNFYAFVKVLLEDNHCILTQNSTQREGCVTLKFCTSTSVALDAPVVHTSFNVDIIAAFISALHFRERAANVAKPFASAMACNEDALLSPLLFVWAMMFWSELRNCKIQQQKKHTLFHLERLKSPRLI